MTLDIFADFNTFLLSIFPRPWLLTVQVMIGAGLMALYFPLLGWSPRFRFSGISDRCAGDMLTLWGGRIGLAVSAFIGFWMVIDAVFSPTAPRGPTMLATSAFALIQLRGAYTAWRAHRMMQSIAPLPPYEAHAPMH